MRTRKKERCERASTRKLIYSAVGGGTKTINFKKWKSRFLTLYSGSLNPTYLAFALYLKSVKEG